MGAARKTADAAADSVKVSNRRGRGRPVIVCEHASNRLPPEYGTLGLEAGDLLRHIAWDPGALPVAEIMAALLDAPLVQSCVSRLVIDCNRHPDAFDLVAETSETTVITGNRGLDASARERRLALVHRPFHDAVAALLDERREAGLETWLVSVHSFTPVYRGIARPWQVGIVHDEDARLAAPLIAALKAEPGLEVGTNQPYSPADRVYYTHERHARPRGLPCAMIEIRNDEVATAADRRWWGELFARVLSQLDLSPEREETFA